MKNIKTILIRVVSTYGFYYLDNNWLNRQENK